MSAGQRPEAGARRSAGGSFAEAVTSVNARIRLSQQAETTRTRNREIRAEVVVQIGGDDGVGRWCVRASQRRARNFTRPAGEANASCASDADNRIAIAGQRDGSNPHGAGRQFRNRRQRERQRFVGRCRRRVRILQAHEAHQRLADFRARRADLGKRRPVRRLAQENVLQERDLRGRRSRVGGGRRQQRFQLLLCIGRPCTGCGRQRRKRRVERCLVSALRRDPCVFETRDQVVAARDELLEHALRAASFSGPPSRSVSSASA